jgi:hypothetical protein
MHFVIHEETSHSPEVEVSGSIGAHDFLALLDTVLASPHWRPGKRVLVDCSAGDFSMMLVLDVHTLVKAFRQLDAHIGRSRMALVVGSAAEYGLVRMFEQLLHGQVKLETAVFFSVDDARAWLSH